MNAQTVTETPAPALDRIAARGNLPQLTRSPAVPHYESFYLRAHRPGGYEAFWIKYTLLRRLDGRTSVSTWLTYWNADEGRPRAFKETRSQAELKLEDGGHILGVGDSYIAPGRAEGSASYEGGSAGWDLSFTEGEPPFFHLPKERMYRAKLPRTKLLSPYPQSVFHGMLDVGGKAVSVDNWPGMMGHNWGTQHSERWVWLNCNEFEGQGADTYFDGAAGRVRLGPIVTPWLPVAMAVVGGRRYMFNTIAHGLRGKVRDDHTSCELVLKGRGAEARFRVSAPAEQFIGLVYQDPDGKVHNTLNCSIADAELELRPKHGAAISLRSRGGASYEIGVLERDHPVQMAPFGDY